MREYKIIDIAGAFYTEINNAIPLSCCYYTTAGYRIFVHKFSDGDIIVTTLNLCTMEYFDQQYVISINKVIDKLVAYNEDFIPYIYE